MNLLSCNIYYSSLWINFHNLSRVQLGEAPLVKTAASVFQELCYNYRDQLMAGIICAGWDKRHGGQVSLNHLVCTAKNCIYMICKYRFLIFRLEACV